MRELSSVLKLHYNSTFGVLSLSSNVIPHPLPSLLAPLPFTIVGSSPGVKNEGGSFISSVSQCPSCLLLGGGGQKKKDFYASLYPLSPPLIFIYCRRGVILPAFSSLGKERDGFVGGEDGLVVAQKALREKGREGS